jgi:hypothetical protein
MTRDDVLCYLDKGRKTENEDPLHKWIGSYNTKLMTLSRFFKWIYYSDIDDPKRRSELSALERKPDCIMGINQLKRKEISHLKPSDLWSQEDDLLFLKLRTICAKLRDHSRITTVREKPICFRWLGNNEGDSSSKNYHPSDLNDLCDQNTLQKNIFAADASQATATTNLNNILYSKQVIMKHNMYYNNNHTNEDSRNQKTFLIKR